jgi:hypothetical protein
MVRAYYDGCVAALAPPRDLTIPEAGSTTARDVLSRAIGRLLSELRPLLRAHAASAPEDVDAMDQVLSDVMRTDVGPLASILRRPHAAALVRTLRATPPGSGGAILDELLATLAVDLATLGALPRPREARSSHSPARVVSLVSRRDSGDYRAIDGDIVLALADNNPLAMLEAHPDKHGNAIDLGGRSVDEWTRALRDALALVAEHMPDLRAEMSLFVQQIVPVGYDAGKHVSASYREAIGTVYMSLHPSTMTMTEAIVHEFQHNKLNALFEIDDVLENAFAPLYASPVRPDPRPLHGVLLAVHAFLPVARLYERMLEARHALSRAPGFEARWHDVVRINREGAAVLREHARPTPVGRALLDEIARWDAYFEERLVRAG